jgi:hypothetical protein
LYSSTCWTSQFTPCSDVRLGEPLEYLLFTLYSSTPSLAHNRGASDFCLTASDFSGITMISLKKELPNLHLSLQRCIQKASTPRQPTDKCNRDDGIAAAVAANSADSRQGILWFSPLSASTSLYSHLKFIWPSIIWSSRTSGPKVVRSHHGLTISKQVR